MLLYCQEAQVDKTQNARCGESPVYESCYDKPGDLYRAGIREHGRCTGRIYVGDGKPVGWVFLKRSKYEDTREPFLLETWVTVHTAPDTVTHEPHYFDLH